MPLNKLQSETLELSIRTHVDAIFDDKGVCEHDKVAWLQRSITPQTLILSMAIEMLKSDMQLLEYLSSTISLPKDVHVYWNNVVLGIACSNSTLYESALPTECNYNPLCIAEMKLFEKEISSKPNLSSIGKNLIALREAYLEMTPLRIEDGSYLRVQRLPFDLDSYQGTSQGKIKGGDIQKEIKKYVENQLQPYQKKITEQAERQKKEAETAKLMAVQKTVSGLKHSVRASCENFERGVVSQPEVYAQEDAATKFERGPSAKAIRLLEMQNALINRILDLIRPIRIEMAKIELDLKKSDAFATLRAEEFCTVLLDVQLKVLERYCGIQDDAHEETIELKTAFNAIIVHGTYKKEFQEKLNLYLGDFVTTWMSARREWLVGSDGKPLTNQAFSGLSKEFKAQLQTAISLAIKKFEFQINTFDAGRKLRSELQAAKKTQHERAVQSKAKWDAAIFPLAELAEQCGELKKLQYQVEGQEIEFNLDTFNEVLSALVGTVPPKVPPLELSKTDQTTKFNFFHYACWGGGVKLVQKLLAHAVPMQETRKLYEVPDDEQNSVIHLAVENQSSVTTELLTWLYTKLCAPNKVKGVLELRNKSNKTPLHSAAAYGNLSAIIWIKENDQKAFREGLAVEARGGMTPLHYAAREGHADVVKVLLEGGAGSFLKSEDKNHPLMLAIKHRHTDVYKVFLQEGICLSARQKGNLLTMAKGDPRFSCMLAFCLQSAASSELNDASQFISPTQLGFDVHAALSPAVEERKEQMEQVEQANRVESPEMLVAYNSRARSDALVSPSGRTSADSSAGSTRTTVEEGPQ